MGFHAFELDDHAHHYCVISTPFRLYQYLRLAMGLTNSPDVFQSVMKPLLQDVPVVECLTDDIGVFTNSSFDNLVHCETSSSHAGRKWFCYQPTQM